MEVVDSWVVWLGYLILYKQIFIKLIDLIFNGGMDGMSVSNQQFTVRNVTMPSWPSTVLITGATDFLCIRKQYWNIQHPQPSGWTFQGINISNCKVGFNLRNYCS
jgi:hypothetical protein